MKGEEAMEIFKLMKQRGGLPQKLNDLVPLSFIGQAAVSFYRSKIKLMDQLKMTEAQRKATLRDGQDAGEMLLDIETRIGELALKEPAILAPDRPKGRGRAPSGQPLKHERIGISEHRMKQSEAISKHPEIVEKVKAQARENEDIPTRTAVITEIKYQKEKERRKEAEGKQTESKAVMAMDEKLYINALERCITTLPKQPPKQWSEIGFKEAKGYAQILMGRLEVFDGQK